MGGLDITTKYTIITTPAEIKVIVDTLINHSDSMALKSEGFLTNICAQGSALSLF
jgi:hypothetical protein